MLANSWQSLAPISVSGCFWTGSGAVVDLLSEHPLCHVPKIGEFTFFSHGTLFSELLTSIQTGDYHTIEKTLWRASKFNEYEFPIVFSAVRRLCSTFHYYPRQLFVHRRSMSALLGHQYSQACSDFLSAVESQNHSTTEEYIGGIQAILSAVYQSVMPSTSKARCFIFDQMVAPCHVKNSVRLVPDLKVVCVDRNWRDQYVELRSEVPRMVSTKISIGQDALGLNLERDDVDPLVLILKLRRQIEEIKHAIERDSKEHCLWINFEDLVENTESVSAQIFSFLGLDASEWRRETVFFAEKSARNIGKWKNSNYREEIEQIEVQLEI